MGNKLSVKRKRIRKGSISVKSGSQTPRSAQPTMASSGTSNSIHTTGTHSLGGDTEFDQARYDANQIQELHYLFKHIFQRNLIAPAEHLLRKTGAQCLDIGCGPTATWLIDMAAEFPQATFTGIDIVDIGPMADSLPSPTSASLLPRHIPANCHFKKVDVLQNIDLPCATFDHIYQRFMFNVYQMDESIQPKFLELAGLLKPGGYIELIEPDMIPKKAGPKYTLLANALCVMLKPRHKQLFHGPVIKQRLIDAGLVDVQADYTSIPICWGGYVGKMLYETIVSVLGKLGEALWPLLELEGDYDEQVFIDFMDSAMDECVDYKTYVNFHWAYGKRPLENESINKES
ncbi:unnamed protein product [Absidia cylindrospora]